MKYALLAALPAALVLSAALGKKKVVTPEESKSGPGAGQDLPA